MYKFDRSIPDSPLFKNNVMIHFLKSTLCVCVYVIMTRVLILDTASGDPAPDEAEAVKDAVTVYEFWLD